MTDVVIALFFLSVLPPAVEPPNFSGHWRLVGQETSAFRGRGSIGNHEGPVRITQTADRLLVVLEPGTGPTGKLDYDLMGRDLPTSESAIVESRSRWDGTTLVTTGRRAFTTPSGLQVYRFEERRRLSADGRRMRCRADDRHDSSGLETDVDIRANA